MKKTIATIAILFAALFCQAQFKKAPIGGGKAYEMTDSVLVKDGMERDVKVFATLKVEKPVWDKQKGKRSDSLYFTRLVRVMAVETSFKVPTDRQLTFQPQSNNTIIWIKEHNKYLCDCTLTYKNESGQVVEDKKLVTTEAF